MKNEKNLGIYIHIPFCVQKCPYCGFLSAPPESDDEVENYVDHLVKEIGMAGGVCGSDRIVDTVFIGGGTPSLLSSEHIWHVMNALSAVFDMADETEITIEANPGTLTPEKVRGYLGSGINRLSMGVQAMDDELLRSLGRIHRKEDVTYSFDLARKAGFENINLDLMFGMPGQDMAMWKDTLSRTIEMDPEHISFYSLQIEEKTPFYDMYRDGKLDTATDEMERAMHHQAIQMLEDAGFSHYEISNSAKPGKKCRHNLKYWSMEEYLGLGPGAHSYVAARRQEQAGEDGSGGFKGGLRYNNITDLSSYFDFIEQGRLSVDAATVRADTCKDAMGIYVFTGLRKREGIDLREFEARFGKPFASAFDMADKAEKWKAEGLTEQDRERFRLTEKGIDLSNDIMSEFV